MSVPGPAATVTELFLALAAVPSPSGRERAVAELIRAWLSAVGVSASLDGAGSVNGSDAGNLIATAPGAAAAPVLLFVAHMDTVESGSPAVSPRIGDDGVIRSAGGTILGADNKSAVAAVMRLCAYAARMPQARRPTVIAAFTCREESGRMGASLLDRDLLASVDCAFCIDGSRPVGTVITRALGQATFTYEIEGRRAHAAADPGAGVDAIAAAAELVAALALGRRPHGGSVSVGSIAGGAVLGGPSTEAAILATPTNSIADRALVRGEVRGFTASDIEADMAGIERTLQEVCSRAGALYRRLGDPRRMVPPFPGTADSRALALVREAAQRVDGVALVAAEAQATLEANYLAAGTDVVAVASGGRDPHQVSESITVAELEQLEALLIAILGAATPAG